jgi:hypothetical protein
VHHIEISRHIRRVTAARRGLETAAVEYGDVPALIFDQAETLKRAGGAGNADATYAKHVCQKFVCDMKRVRVSAILSHQQPACEALLDLMET